MFEKLIDYAKSELKIRGITYAQLAETINVSENSIKCFMCGRNTSHKIAERIADLLDCKLVYSNNEYICKPQKYINPIPYIDMAKEFEFRMRLVSDEVIETKEAKRRAAEFIKNMSIDELCKWLSCKSFPVYPEN